MRAYVMGTSGSGKSTFSASLASEHNLNHLELDSLRHQSNWTPLPDDEMRHRVEEFCKQDDWVVDGNYSFVRDLIIDRATDVFMLDFSKAVVMYRVITRSLYRVITRKELWNGNRENWRFLFKLDPEENVILWAWTTYAKRRQDFNEVIEQLPTSIRAHRLRSPKQARELLKSLLAS